ncbi:50S ribosomal protein L3 [Geothermobacter hydrogeniphilus]|uniref:Large ribosomal subunit protein uL3 n=1 Tax=Geothermobacter hydrogeniphilus TaxID=1969733 RepID=A0A1X0YD22_9BACT|nr:50S ribosomal protein L3 [Geothermobacter hydrogeniphilus]
MIKGILGKKLGMTQIYAADGRRVPVTVVEAGPCVVLQKKTVESDGYNAVQLGFAPKAAHRVNKPELGHFKKAGKGAFAHLKEFRVKDIDGINVGDEVTCADIFQIGDIVDITGTSKGKGYQGVMKRWNFAGGRSSHGSKFHRAPGAIGCSAWPSRVFKGKKMAGQMGNERVTTQNLAIVDVRPEQNLLLIKGAVPGSRNSVVTIRPGVKLPTE